MSGSRFEYLGCANENLPNTAAQHLYHSLDLCLVSASCRISSGHPSAVSPYLGLLGAQNKNQSRKHEKIKIGNILVAEIHKPTHEKVSLFKMKIIWLSNILQRRIVPIRKSTKHKCVYMYTQFFSNCEKHNENFKIDFFFFFFADTHISVPCRGRQTQR